VKATGDASSMKFEDFLQRLEMVRRSGHGWMARCPAHDDRTPSLSIRDSDKGILLKCWAGCTVSDITDALGLRLADLFYGSERLSDGWRRLPPQDRQPPFDWRKHAGDLEDEAIGLRLRAEKVLSAARELDVSAWSNDDIEAGFSAVERAYVDRERAECFEALAFNVRMYGLQKEKKRER
jgi:hypothetical protein